MERSSSAAVPQSTSETRSKKRALENTVTVDLGMDVVELSPEEFDFEANKLKRKAKGKGKQVMTQDVIDVDNDDSYRGMTNKVNLCGSYKGKDLIYLSDGDDNYDTKKTLSFKEQNLYSMTNGGTGTANYLQAQFEAADTPSETEVSIPWWFEPGGTESPSVNSVHEDATKRIQQFDNFAVVDVFSDHHFANKSFSTQKAWTKKIQDEWKILQSSLPETIFVRACESNMALLRAVIIGPQGTPYHDGLFFFDHVHYHSGGLRLNPNLYDNGYVCLSLLGTWQGRSACEKWKPGKSTMLQVLVSIQALILNAKPYYNEPGYTSYEGSAYGEQASEQYNEDTLVKSLRTMLYSLRRPPKHFEGFVSDYFITRSHGILLASKAYMDGAQVGSISVLEGKAVRGNNKSCSDSLKVNVGMILNSLIEEFAKLGVKNCDEYRIPESKNEESQVVLVKSSESHSQKKLMFSQSKIAKVKSKKTSGHMSFLFPPALSVAYPTPLPPAAWTSPTPAWISPPLAVHASPATMFNLPQPVMSNILHYQPTDPHNYSVQKPSNPNQKGNV